jgi:hypothetical protein
VSKGLCVLASHCNTLTSDLSDISVGNWSFCSSFMTEHGLSEKNSQIMSSVIYCRTRNMIM